MVSIASIADFSVDFTARYTGVRARNWNGPRYSYVCDTIAYYGDYDWKWEYTGGFSNIVLRPNWMRDYTLPNSPLRPGAMQFYVVQYPQSICGLWYAPAYSAITWNPGAETYESIDDPRFANPYLVKPFTDGELAATVRFTTDYENGKGVARSYLDGALIETFTTDLDVDPAKLYSQAWIFGGSEAPQNYGGTTWEDTLHVGDMSGSVWQVNTATLDVLLDNGAPRAKKRAKWDATEWWNSWQDDAPQRYLFAPNTWFRPYVQPSKLDRLAIDEAGRIYVKSRDLPDTTHPNALYIEVLEYSFGNTYAPYPLVDASGRTKLLATTATQVLYKRAELWHTHATDTQPIIVATGTDCTAPCLAAMDDTHLCAFWMDATQRGAYSTDDGQTWTAYGATMLGSSLQNLHVIERGGSLLACGVRDGGLYFVWSNDAGATQTAQPGGLQEQYIGPCDDAVQAHIVAYDDNHLGVVARSDADTEIRYTNSTGGFGAWTLVP